MYTPLTITTGELLFIPGVPWDYYDTVRVCLTTVEDSTEPTPFALWDSVCALFYTDLVPPVLISRQPDSAETVENEIYGMIFEYFDSGCGINSSDWELIINEDTFYPGSPGIIAGEETLLINLFSADISLLCPGNNFIEFTIRDNPDTCGPNEKTYSWWFVYDFEGIDEAELPEDFGLSVWPNPFNGTVRIRVSGIGYRVSGIDIFDINGRNVANIPVGAFERTPNNKTGAFYHTSLLNRTIIWTPSDKVTSGIYLIRAKYGDKTEIKKVMYLK